jgi:multiple sugar transport system substrate-binding protein
MSQFTEGKAAMMVNGTWQMRTLTESDMNWGVAEIPAPAGKTSVAPLGGEMWTATATGDATRQAKAVEILKCIGSTETEVKLGSEDFTVPVLLDAIPEFLEKNPAMASFAEAVKNGRSRTAKLGSGWTDASTTIANGIQLVLTDSAAPADAMKQAAAQ